MNFEKNFFVVNLIEKMSSRFLKINETLKKLIKLNK